MIKRIPVGSLKVGMYLSDLNRDWIPHNNKKAKGRISSEAVIEKIIALSVKDVYIDTSKGLDSEDSIPVKEVQEFAEKEMQKIGDFTPAIKSVVSLAEERERVEALHMEAKQVVDDLMRDVQSGKNLNIEGVEQLAEGILDSVFRNHNALTCLGRIREKDSYLMEHSINLSVLMSVYGKFKQFKRSEMQEMVSGALLHDIGKTLVPDKVLHKPGRLTFDEFEIMKDHVTRGREILDKTPGIAELTKIIQSQHHEKIDGSGYPLGLKGDEISIHGKMVAVVDVYDAITADRCYHDGMTPTDGMRKLIEWTDHHMDRNLVADFIHCMGVYPVGSFVLLESQRIGVVIEPNEFAKKCPLIKLVYNTDKQEKLLVKHLDLAKPSNQDAIVKTVYPESYGLKVSDYL